MSDPAELSLVELLPLLDARSLSARELVDACLVNVERHEPDVRAFVSLTPDLALAAAGRADADRAAGRPVGLLAGVPVAIKDVYLTRGVPTTASSRVLSGHEPGVDAELWTRLQTAGAGLLGKTALHEFAYGTGSEPTRNPWDQTRTPGGSSGGSAAALAARMAPVAMGTDTGGSLRIPAAACGVSSLRPTTGRLPTAGVLPLSGSFDTAGPMGRRMRDVALLLKLLTGRPYPQAGDLTGVRLGLPATLWAGVDADLARLCRSALQDSGATLVEVDGPGGDEAAYRHTVQWEARSLHAPWLAATPDLYGPQVRARLEQAAATTAEQYAAARASCAQLALGWREVLAGAALDGVATPTIPARPEPIAADGTQTGPALTLTRPWSVTAFPALSVPVGLDARGLPVGLQLAALPEREAQLVGFGIAVDEQARLWERTP